MKSDPLFRIQMNPIEHFHDEPDFDLQAGLLKHLAGNSRFERLAELEPPSGESPTTGERLESALDEHNLAVLDDDAANADDGL